MSIVYDEFGHISKVRFTDTPEPRHTPHWYAVGTRIIFAKGESCSVPIQVALA